MFIVFNIALLNITDISAAIETVNVTNSNLTPDVTGTMTNTTNLKDINFSNSNNGTLIIQNNTCTASDDSNTKNTSSYTNIRGV